MKRYKRVIPDDQIIEMNLCFKEDGPLINFEIEFGKIDQLISELQHIKNRLEETDIYSYEESDFPK